MVGLIGRHIWFALIGNWLDTTGRSEVSSSCLWFLNARMPQCILKIRRPIFESSIRSMMSLPCTRASSLVPSFSSYSANVGGSPGLRVLAYICSTFSRKCLFIWMMASG
jgi:hypothetical protein